MPSWRISGHQDIHRTGLFPEVDHQPPQFEYMLVPISLTIEVIALFDVEFEVMI